MDTELVGTVCILYGGKAVFDLQYIYTAVFSMDGIDCILFYRKGFYCGSVFFDYDKIAVLPGNKAVTKENNDREQKNRAE